MNDKGTDLFGRCFVRNGGHCGPNPTDLFVLPFYPCSLLYPVLFTSKAEEVIDNDYARVGIRVDQDIVKFKGYGYVSGDFERGFS